VYDISEMYQIVTGKRILVSIKTEHGRCFNLICVGKGECRILG
jgi:hypothetical protein